MTAKAQVGAGVGGAVIAVVLGAVVMKLMGRRRAGYTEVSELTV
jgi:hypothetical protein